MQLDTMAMFIATESWIECSNSEHGIVGNFREARAELLFMHSGQVIGALTILYNYLRVLINFLM